MTHEPFKQVFSFQTRSYLILPTCSHTHLLDAGANPSNLLRFNPTEAVTYIDIQLKQRCITKKKKAEKFFVAFLFHTFAFQPRTIPSLCRSTCSWQNAAEAPQSQCASPYTILLRVLTPEWALSSLWHTTQFSHFYWSSWCRSLLRFVEVCRRSPMTLGSNQSCYAQNLSTTQTSNISRCRASM